MKVEKCDNHQQCTGQPYEIRTQIQFSHEILRLVSLWMIRPGLANIAPKVLSLPGSRLLMSQAALSHFGVERNSSFFKQVSAISRSVQKLIITQACVSLAEVRAQGHLTAFQVTRKRLLRFVQDAGFCRCGDASYPAASTASAMRAASMAGRTSWTRTIDAPLRMAAVSAARLAASRASTGAGLPS